jgi:hypothetical protein
MGAAAVQRGTGGDRGRDRRGAHPQHDYTIEIVDFARVSEAFRQAAQERVPL